MKKILFKRLTKTIGFVLALAFPALVMGQVTYNGNGNSGFAGAVGGSNISINDNGTTITGTFNKGSGSLNDIIVIYISNGSNGRTIMGFNDNDQSDGLRRAVTNAFGNAINFPAGFEATHAIAIEVGNSALFGVPTSGNIGTGSGNNELNFIKAVGSPTSNTQASFTFSFDWTDIGLTSTDDFGFVITYGNGSGGTNSDAMFSSDEGYGNGIPSPNPGFNGWTYTTYFDYPSGDIGGLATTAQATNWSNVNTWTNGNVPLAGDEVEINHDVILDQDATVTSATISSGNTLTSEAAQGRTLTVEDGGSFTNNGTFTANDGTVSFSGGATISGTTTFNDVDIAGGVDFGSNSTVSGSLTVNAGGSAQTNAPIYGGSSTLIFATGGTYDIGGGNTLWASGNTVGQGVPNNVEVTTTTPLNIFAARDVTGKLTIGSSAAVVQGNNGFTIQGDFENSGTYSFVSDGASPLTVQGDFLNNNGASFSLSDQIGGDLNLSGNFTDDGSFTANGRAVFFTGANTQTVTSATDPLTIDFLIIDKSSNNVEMLQNLDLPNNVELTNGNLDLNGNTLTISGDIRPNSGNGALIANGSGSTLIFDDQSSARSLESGDLQNDEVTNLTVNESGGLSIDLGLTVTGDLNIGGSGVVNVTSGNYADLNNVTNDGTLNTRADANGYGQVVVRGNRSGNGNTNFETYLASQTQWYNVAFPLTNTDFSNVSSNEASFNFTSGQENVYYYDAYDINADDEGTWKVASSNQTIDPSNTSANAVNAFSIYLDNNYFGTLPATISASGNLVSGNQTINLAENGRSGSGNGWNYIGNPFATTIDWDEVVNNNGNLSTTYWVQDGDGTTNGSGQTQGKWYAYNQASGSLPSGADSTAEQFIAPGQAFFVQSTNGLTSMTIEENDVDLTQTPVLRKNSRKPNSVTLQVKDLTTTLSDYTWIGFEMGRTDSKDEPVDAEKLFNDTKTFPAIYTKGSQNEMIYNFLDDQFSYRTVDLYLEYEQDQKSLEIEGFFDYLDPTWSVLLEDKLKNRTVNLRNQNYTFTHKAANMKQRFTLHINKGNYVGSEELDVTEVYAFVEGDQLKLNLDQWSGQGIARVYDLQGRVIASQEVSGGNTSEVSLSGYAPGLYVVKVTAQDEEVLTQKIIK